MQNSKNLNNHITLRHSNDVREICKPLFDLLGIEHFMFTFYFTDNSIARLSTCPEWTQHYLSKEYYNVVPTLNNNEFPVSYSIWNLLDGNHNSFLNMLNEAQQFKIHNGFTIIKYLKDYKIVCSICTPRGATYSNDLYLYNLDCVESFIYYFLNKAHPLIEMAKKYRIYINNSLAKSIDKNNENEFYKAIALNKIYFKDVLLSKRETLCLLHIMRGKSSKKIAKVLNISSRTIDTYINNIKIKTNCRDRDSLIEEAYQTESVRGAFLRMIATENRIIAPIKDLQEPELCNSGCLRYS